ncbi:MAG TPA: hypothetical protein ENI85_05825, partial [Deltaproteobacteria bacterium]|nr:hypothetical protein [Deltaproteobacteria bacterium]
MKRPSTSRPARPSRLISRIILPCPTRCPRKPDPFEAHPTDSGGPRRGSRTRIDRTPTGHSGPLRAGLRSLCRGLGVTSRLRSGRPPSPASPLRQGRAGGSAGGSSSFEASNRNAGDRRGGRVGRRIIICDGAESARLWSRIGADEQEELLWIPREDEGRARPSGFKILQGGLDEDAIAKLEPGDDDEFALVSDDGPWTRLAVRKIRKVDEDASILVLSDSLTEEDLPDHPSLRRTGWKTLIRDDINEEFDHLANLQRVVKMRELLGSRERVGILVQPDPDPDGIASAYALRALLGRKRTTAPLISFGDVQRPENQALCDAIGIEVRVITPDEINEFDGLVLVDVQPNVFGDDPPERLREIDVVVDHHPERTGYHATIQDIRTNYGATSSIFTEYLRATKTEINPRLATALLYGIKSDTQYLGRETSERDMLA